jgi:TonB-linked SusC/RagA family outer membrane protein
MKHKTTVLFFLLSMPAILFAATNGKIQGKITDKQTRVALPNATVMAGGTNFGAAADANGNYSFELPAGTYTLEARYLGYQSENREIKVKEGETITENFELLPTQLTTSPVVVTAMGTEISREKLGTPVSSVSGAALVESGAYDLVSALAGKAPGVYTTETGGDPGAATRIILRGVRSLMNDNQPLVILNGVPIFSGTVQPNNFADVGGVSTFSQLTDINPSNIQSIEIYKGPSAAAIWGSRAANGVIVINTKMGSYIPKKKINISMRESMQYDQLIREDPLQTEFGQGANGAYIWDLPFSWGDRIADRSGAADVLSDPNYPYSPITEKNSKQVYNHVSELYQKPISNNYGITFSGGDQSGNFYLAINRLEQTGIVIDNQNFTSTSIRGDVSKTYSENITLHINAAYVNSSSERVQQGSNISGILLGAYRTPPDFNNQPWLVDYVSPSGLITPNQQRTFRNGSGNPANGPGYNNPFFAIYMDPTNFNTQRLLASSDITYAPLDWLSFTYRAGLDYLNTDQTSVLGYGDATSPSLKGQYYDQSFSQYMVNSDIQGRAHHELNPDFSGSLLLGFHIDAQKYNQIGVTSSTFLIPTAPPSLANSTTYVPGQDISYIHNAAMYGLIDLSIYNQLYVSLSGRDEASSTYGPSTSDLYFYPSASVAWEFTKLPVFEGNEILTYGKLRAAIGTAANQPPVYSSSTYYIANPVWGNGWGPAIGLQYYNGGTAISNTLGNPNLGPEKTNEKEIGFDLKLLNDRVSLGATYYYDKTTDAILPLQVAPSTGYTNIYKNAAILENKGTELYANVNWLQIGDFSWSTNTNFSLNRNKVLDLAGVTNVFLNGFTDPYSAAVLNEPIGVLYGTRWDRQKDSNGNIIPGSSMVLDANGFPQIAATPGVIGDPNAKWLMSITNTFRYKRITLSFQIDIKHGGDVWNGTKGALAYFGKAGDQNWWTTISAAQATTLKNYDGYTVAEMEQGLDWGVTLPANSGAFRRNSDGTYSFRGYVTDFGGGPVIIDESYFYDGPGSGFTGPAEQFIENGSYVKLRQVTLSYLLPLSEFGIESVEFSVTGRNLGLWTDYTGVDPETNLTGPTNGQGLDYFNNPSIKSWIFSLKFNY